jgi:hypothetical protein
MQRRVWVYIMFIVLLYCSINQYNSLLLLSTTSSQVSPYIPKINLIEENTFYSKSDPYFGFPMKIEEMDSTSNIKTSTASPSPIEKLTSLLSSSSFLFIVCASIPPLKPSFPMHRLTTHPTDYRGSWCPFCISYLRSLQSLSPSITALGGRPVIITSENASFLQRTREKTEYQGDAIADPQNELIPWVKERWGWDIAVSEKNGYEWGMAQPGVLVVRPFATSTMINKVAMNISDGPGGYGKKEEVLEKWAIVPSLMNMGGAKDRPLLEEVWDNAKSRIEGGDAVHQSYRKISVLGTMLGKMLGR